jgi:hypothetical protein
MHIGRFTIESFQDTEYLCVCKTKGEKCIMFIGSNPSRNKKVYGQVYPQSNDWLYLLLDHKEMSSVYKIYTTQFFSWRKTLSIEVIKVSIVSNVMGNYIAFDSFEMFEDIVIKCNSDTITYFLMLHLHFLHEKPIWKEIRENYLLYNLCISYIKYTLNNSNYIATLDASLLDKEKVSENSFRSSYRINFKTEYTDIDQRYKSYITTLTKISWILQDCMLICMLVLNENCKKNVVSFVQLIPTRCKSIFSFLQTQDFFSDIKSTTSTTNISKHQLPKSFDDLVSF